MNKILPLIVILLLLMSIHTFSEENSDNLRIGIVLIENPGKDPGIESLCETATDTIELTLRLVNKYAVERLDFLLPETNISRAKLYFKSNGFDNAVFGEIECSEEGEYTFIVKGWERSSDSIVVQTEEKSDSVFDMFDIVDSLTIEFIEELSGEHIGFGKITFINEGAEADYNIYVDGNYLGENLEESEILFGKRTFKITDPGSIDDTVVETVTIEVKENGEHNIVFSMGEAGSGLSLFSTDEIVSTENLPKDTESEGPKIFLDNQSFSFKHRYTIQAGGGGILYGGVFLSPYWRWLCFEQLAGMSSIPNYDTLAFSLISKVLFYPLSDIMGMFDLYLGGIFNLQTDSDMVIFDYGLASGFEINLSLFDIFLEADAYNSSVLDVVMIFLALGVRL